MEKSLQTYDYHSIEPSFVKSTYEIHTYVHIDKQSTSAKNMSNYLAALRQYTAIISISTYPS